MITFDSGVSSSWWQPHLKSNLLNTFEPFMFCNSSSMVEMGAWLRIIALFAILMSIHKLMSSPAFGTITTRYTYGVVASTGSIMFLSNSSLILSATLSLKLNGVQLRGWATGLTLGFMYRVTCLDFKFPSNLKTFEY